MLNKNLFILIITTFSLTREAVRWFKVSFRSIELKSSDWISCSLPTELAFSFFIIILEPIFNPKPPNNELGDVGLVGLVGTSFELCFVIFLASFSYLLLAIPSTMVKLSLDGDSFVGIESPEE